MRNFAVVIPAYRPKNDLPQYVNELIQQNVAHVIVVNDGNEEKYEDLFEQLAQFERCTVLHHEFNRGKGGALKTGFNHFLGYHSELFGVVTADADGQHLVKDVVTVGDHLAKERSDFILGVRDFERKNMPIRSFLGNTVTSRVFQGLFGMYIADTQTGLRGIATRELKWVVRLRGNHFEFEMNMLMNMINKEKRIVRVDIEAVYEDEHISHYDTYKDSVRIAGQMVKEYFR
jgi:glycosyltransferase involved in cell wall biosynthesis